MPGDRQESTKGSHTEALIRAKISASTILVCRTHGFCSRHDSDFIKRTCSTSRCPSRACDIRHVYRKHDCRQLCGQTHYRNTELASLDFMCACFCRFIYQRENSSRSFRSCLPLGFSCRWNETIARGANATVFYIRRSAGLLIIGLLGLACTLNTWILVDYAIFGLGLLLFRNWLASIDIDFRHAALILCWLTYSAGLFRSISSKLENSGADGNVQRMRYLE